MPIEPITTTGVIIERYSEKAYRVSLPNGKEVIAHPRKDLREDPSPLLPEVKVRLEMTPYDFEKARIAAIID